jgi:hypothetical protein
MYLGRCNTTGSPDLSAHEILARYQVAACVVFVDVNFHTIIIETSLSISLARTPFLTPLSSHSPRDAFDI